MKNSDIIKNMVWPSDVFPYNWDEEMKKKCKNCGVEITKVSKRCKSCSNKNRSMLFILKRAAEK